MNDARSVWHGWGLRRWVILALVAAAAVAIGYPVAVAIVRRPAEAGQPSAQTLLVEYRRAAEFARRAYHHFDYVLSGKGTPYGQRAAGHVYDAMREGRFDERTSMRDFSRPWEIYWWELSVEARDDIARRYGDDAPPMARELIARDRRTRGAFRWPVQIMLDKCPDLADAVGRGEPAAIEFQRVLTQGWPPRKDLRSTYGDALVVFCEALAGEARTVYWLRRDNQSALELLDQLRVKESGD